MISREFITAVKLADQPAYKLAQRVDIHPVTLSKIITGYQQVSPGDERVLAVGALLGLTPEQCFADPEPQAA